MRATVRLGIALIAFAMLTAPVAYSVSTRPVHEAYYDAFVPEETDGAAQVQDAVVNCGDPGVEGQSADTHVTSHDGTSELSGADEDGDNLNSELPCWGTDDHNLWADDDGKVHAASAPFYACSAQGVDLEVSLQNPYPLYVPDPVAGDEVSDEDAFAKRHGVVKTSGSFYVVPELSGSDASEVEAIWFSFLETAPTAPEVGIGGGSDEVCLDSEAGAASAGGAYYEFYRGDTDRSDGWTIPINTLLVPDNLYGAKLTFLGHSDTLEDAGVDENQFTQPYPGGLDVLGMGYVYAIVDNDADDTTFQPCEPTRDPCDNQDTTPPWPQVVPGDVPLDDVEDRGTLEVTFGEHVVHEKTEIKVNGVSQGHGSITHDSSDVDSVPLFTATTDDWGESFEVELDTDLTPCDEIQITASDLHGNQATKKILADEDACESA